MVKIILDTDMLMDCDNATALAMLHALADEGEVYREALAEAQNQQVKIVTIGYMSNLASLLQSGPDACSEQSGRELVCANVSEWVCMGGNFPVDPAEDNVNFTRDAGAAVCSIRNWPGRITFVGREIGHHIFVGEALKRTPFENPVRRASQFHRERIHTHRNHHTAEADT